jgi:flavin reductase (DIM6/NTAB) family NADH-FMN oxidoreductase RutF
MMNDKALFSISYGLYVLGAEGPDGFSGCVVDAFIQSTANPPSVILCNQKHTFTHECIQRTGRFSVSVLRKDVDPLTIGIFGFQSTRSMLKWPLVAHTMLSGLPVLQDAVAWYLCKVRQSIDLSTHTLYHCDLLEAELGQGEPLTYAYYREHVRRSTAAAFQAFKQEMEKDTP